MQAAGEDCHQRSNTAADLNYDIGTAEEVCCGVANCFLVGFEACSSGGSTASTVNLVKAVAGEVMDPSGEDTAVVLVNGCDVTNYVCA